MRKAFVQALSLVALGMLYAISARAGDTVYYYHTDASHSAVVVTDANHHVVERTYYGPYGEVLNRPLRDGPGYTGHEEDAATGLVYMQQRYYDPTVKRFPTVDPVDVDTTIGANFNCYWYANDNPYRFTDPDGREAGDLSLQSSEYMQGNLQAFDGRESGFSSGSAEAIAGVAPVVGDIQNIAEAYNNPSLGNIAIAAVGVVPEVGAAIAKVAKVAKAAKAAGRVGDFTRAQKNAAKAENAAINGGKMACTDCGKVLENVKSEKGVPTPPNQAQVHHDPAIKDGGGQHSEPVVLCPTCHKERHGSDGG